MKNNHLTMASFLEMDPFLKYINSGEYDQEQAKNLYWSMPVNQLSIVVRDKDNEDDYDAFTPDIKYSSIVELDRGKKKFHVISALEIIKLVEILRLNRF